MSATLNEENTRTRKRGSRGRPDRPSRRPGGAPRHSDPEQHAERVERSERLALESARLANPDAPERYARVHRAALLEAVEEVSAGGSRLDAFALMLAASRAASRTWSLSAAHPSDSERVRVQVVAEERERLGVLVERIPPLPSRDSEEAREDEDRLPVPPGRALPGDKIRRGGSRR